MGEPNDDHHAAEAVLGAGSAVLEDDALDDLLRNIVVLARQTLVHAHAVSITVADNGRYRTSSFTADEALAIDEAQYEAGDGPCLEALRSSRQVELAVGADGDRWPNVQARAQELGIANVLSTPLVRAPNEAIGALNVYSRDGDGFGEADRRTAELLGEHSAVVVANATALVASNMLNEQLRAALASREIIGEAKGIIMERQSCTRDEAFDILRRASQRENRKLRDLAEEVVRRVESRRGSKPGT